MKESTLIQKKNIQSRDENVKMYIMAFLNKGFV